MKLAPASPALRRFGAILFVGATWFAFPQELPGVGAFDLGLLASWLVSAGLILAVDGLSIGAAGRRAFVFSFLAHTLIFHWFAVVTVEYAGMPVLLGLLAPLLPALYVAPFSAGFAMFFTASRARGLSAVFVAGAGWVAFDWARAHFLGGFPWATLGYGLHQDLALLAHTRWAGVYGLSFVAAGVGAALAGVMRDPAQMGTRKLLATAAGVAALHGLGWGIAAELSPDAPTLRVAAIQGNIDQGEKWDESRRRRILEKYLALSDEAASLGADWIVWPETSVPGLIEFDAALEAALSRFAARTGTPLVVGGMGAQAGADGRVSAYFDSAYVFDRRGARVDRYDKTQLVPFGEFLPFRRVLGRLVEALASGLAPADVTAGPRPRALRWREVEVAGPSLRVGVPICYELLFPHRVRGFAADGADVLLAITNDAWYGRTGAPHQFLAMTAVRAAENGRWLVRAANTGFSAVIDAQGRVRTSSALFEDAVLVGELPAEGGLEPTWYTQRGDVFAAACVLMSVVALGLRRGERRQRPRATDRGAA